MRAWDRLAELLWRDVYDHDEIGQPIQKGTSLWTRTRALRKSLGGASTGAVAAAIAGGIAGSVATALAPRLLDDGDRDILVGQQLKAHLGEATLQCVVDQRRELVCVAVTHGDEHQVARPKTPGSGPDHPNLKATPK